MPGIDRGRKYAAASCLSAAASRIRWRATFNSGFCTFARRGAVARSIGRISSARIDGGVGGGGDDLHGRRSRSGRPIRSRQGVRRPSGAGIRCGGGGWSVGPALPRRTARPIQKGRSPRRASRLSCVSSRLPPCPHRTCVLHIRSASRLSTRPARVDHPRPDRPRLPSGATGARVAEPCFSIDRVWTRLDENVGCNRDCGC